MSGRRLLIFDFDGTIADTFGEIVASVNATQARYGYAASEAEELRGWIGYGLRYFMEMAIPEGERSDAHIDTFTTTYKSIYRELAFEKARLFDGIPEVLEAVAADVLALVSNKSVEQLEPMVDRLGIQDRFSVVVGGNSLPVHKPDRGVYDHVADTTGARDLEGWMIGDSEPDIGFGKNAGLTTVGCLWGLRTRDELREAGADHLVEEPGDLLRILTQ